MVTLAKNIDWDTDGSVDTELPDLPTTVVLPDGIDEDDVADYLSDEYGWCVNGCDVVVDEDLDPSDIK
jgi:hypothetical protein